MAPPPADPSNYLIKILWLIWRHVQSIYRNQVCRRIFLWKDMGQWVECACSRRVYGPNACKPVQAYTCWFELHLRSLLVDRVLYHQPCKQYKDSQQLPQLMSDLESNFSLSTYDSITCRHLSNIELSSIWLQSFKFRHMLAWDAFHAIHSRLPCYLNKLVCLK